MCPHLSCCTQVYTRLQERIGLKDHLMVLNAIITKIATNLRLCGSSQDVITLTLNLFSVCLLDFACLSICDCLLCIVMLCFVVVSMMMMIPMNNDISTIATIAFFLAYLRVLW